MEHILNYEILQEWGFVWADKRKIGEKEVVISYFKKESYETDAHGFKPIVLMMFSHPNFSAQWIMQYLEKDDDDSDDNTLFKGIITDDKALKQILKACVFFKPNK